jgi:hypothetical protein
MATPKEPTTSSTTTGTGGVGWYERLCAGAGAARACGEALGPLRELPQQPGALEPTTSIVPDVRLLFMVRDPIARVPSHYLHEVAALRQRRPVEQALRENPIYLDRRRYATQLEHYLDHQLLVLRAEDLFRTRCRSCSRSIGSWASTRRGGRPAPAGVTTRPRGGPTPGGGSPGIGLAEKADLDRHLPQ